MGFLNIPVNSKIYLDANIVVYIIEGFQPYWKILESLLNEIDLGYYIICTSELTVAEVLGSVEISSKPKNRYDKMNK